MSCLSGCGEQAHAGPTKLEELHQAAESLYRQGKLPGIDPGRQSVGLRDRAEDDIQRDIEQELTRRGYIVLHTNEYRRGDACPECGTWVVGAKGRGCSKGVPDLLVLGGTVPAGMAVLLEVKRVKGWEYSSTEQRQLCEGGYVHRVHSVADALEALACKPD